MKKRLTRVLPLIGIISIFLLYNVSADYLVSSYSLSSLEQIKPYAIGDNSYDFWLVYCDTYNQDLVKLRINGELTPQIYINDTYNLNTNYYFRVDSIAHIAVVGYDECILGFSVFTKIKIECERGSYGCCGNKKIIPETDNNNCGICGNRCEAEEKCIYGYCKTYCGNGKCESDENCGTCLEDCGCQPGYQCENNRTCEWVKTDECSSDSDCDDRDVSTEDSCTNSTPRECINRRTKECRNYDEYCPTNCTYNSDNDCSVQNQPGGVTLNEENRNTINDTRFGDTTKNPVQKDKTVLQIVIEWFVRWFE